MIDYRHMSKILLTYAFYHFIMDLSKTGVITMPRPTKCRKICHFPEYLEFISVEGAEQTEAVILNIDEYETIRLIDKEGMSQEQCSEFMQIARTTVQRIYDSARKKLALMLTEGLPLRIEGGDFWLCDGQNADCGQEDCYKHLFYQKYQKPKGEHMMRVAVTYEDGQIFQHFGHTQEFKVYDIEDGKIVSSEVVDTNGSGHGALAGVLNALNAQVLICGGIGGGAQMALAAAGIQLYGGVAGDADAAVEAYLVGNLAYNPNVQCNHHGHHHEEGHACGNHGCGSGEHHCGGH